MSDTPETDAALVEQLKDVPIDGSDCYPISSVHHKNIPYGELCRAAAKEIEQLKRELCEAREAGWKAAMQAVWDRLPMPEYANDPMTPREVAKLIKFVRSQKEAAK